MARPSQVLRTQNKIICQTSRNAAARLEWRFVSGDQMLQAVAHRHFGQLMQGHSNPGFLARTFNQAPAPKAIAALFHTTPQYVDVCSCI
jgi:hypothetical protein